MLFCDHVRVSITLRTVLHVISGEHPDKVTSIPKEESTYRELACQALHVV